MAMASYSSYKATETGATVYPREVSFSSYLDSTETDFVRSLAASIHNQQSQSPAESEYCIGPRTNLGKNGVQHTHPELGVFGADRYFNEKIDEHKSGSPRKNEGLRNKHKYGQEKFENKRTSSPKSHGSCNNNQLGGHKCKGKKSIFTINPQEMVHLEDDQPRQSLEVFGFRNMRKQDTTQNLETKFSLLTWDAIPNSQSFQYQFPFPFRSIKKTSPGMKSRDDDGSGLDCFQPSLTKSDHDYDARSDASSDLFEIENLSGFPPSQTSYATSEGSIEWSVVTASAAELSVVSGFRDQAEMGNTSNFSKKKPTMAKIKVQKSLLPSLGGGFLRCRSHKAIDVVVGSFKK